MKNQSKKDSFSDLHQDSTRLDVAGDLERFRSEVGPFILDYTALHLSFQPCPDGTPVPVMLPHLFWKMESLEPELEKKGTAIMDRLFQAMLHEPGILEEPGVLTALLNDSLRRGLVGRILELAQTVYTTALNLETEPVFALARVVAAGMGQNRLADLFHTEVENSEPVTDTAYRILTGRQVAVSDTMLEMNPALGLLVHASRKDVDRCNAILDDSFEKASQGDSEQDILSALGPLITAGQLYRAFRIMEKWKDRYPYLEVIGAGMGPAVGSVRSLLQRASRMTGDLPEDIRIQVIALLAPTVGSVDSPVYREVMARTEELLRLHQNGHLLAEGALREVESELGLFTQESARRDAEQTTGQVGQQREEPPMSYPILAEWIPAIRLLRQSMHPLWKLARLETARLDLRHTMERQLAGQLIEIIQEDMDAAALYRLKMRSGPSILLSAVLGVYYGMRGNAHRTLAFLDRGGITHPQALHLLAMALHENGRSTRAVRIYRRLTRHHSDQKVFWNNYGILLEQMGFARQAEEAFQRAESEK